MDQWKNVLRDVNSHFNTLQSRQKYEGVQEILALSNHDVPYFLYLGNFPEDYEIPKRKLGRLWIEELFVQTLPTMRKTDQTLEEVAEGYLEEPVNRCMVQVDKRDHGGRGVKSCRMHDLMREHTEGQKGKFFSDYPTA